MVDVLLKARTRVEDKILRAAKNSKFATVRRYREGVYKDIQMEYVRLQGDLNKWADGSTLRTSKAFHALAADDLLLTDADKRVLSFTKFSSKHNEDYITRINPFNADRLVAVNAKLSQMAKQDVNALRSAVVDSFREAQVASLTSGERWKLLQSKTLDYADNPKSWQFIDKAGRKWKRGNYFSMTNRTVSAQVANSSYADTLIDEGRDLVQIQGGLSSNSADACIKWVGRVVSLTGETSGYPALQDYIDDGGFHPNCQHYTVYMSDKFEKSKAIIDEQKGEPSPVVKSPRTKPVIKMSSADKPKP
jgi:hypothetical protein